MGVLRDWIGLSWSSFRRLLGVVWATRSLKRFFLILLAIHLFWIVVFAVVETAWDLGVRDLWLSDNHWFSLTSDHSIPEFINYAQTALLVGVLVWLTRSTGQWVYGAFTLVFIVVLLDDSLEIHEQVGKYFVRLWDIPSIWGLYPKDVGEVIFWAITGTAVVPVVAFGLVFSDGIHRGNGLALGLTFGALLVCAIGVDQLYSNFRESFFGSGNLIDIVEDGGEMVAISTSCALMLAAVHEIRTGKIPENS